MSRQYCSYCGRVAHRCQCDAPESRLQQFCQRASLALAHIYPRWMSDAYKRGVPPQIKRRERYQLRKHYDEWYQALSVRDSEQCANCGSVESLVLDHIISIAKGGQSELDNLQLLCAECNRIKGKLCIDCRDWE